MMKKIMRIYWISIAFIICSTTSLFSQFINNGGHVSLSSGVSIDINLMNFTNLTSTYDGDISSAGKIFIDGSWTNNALGGQLFDSTATSGEVVFNGTSTQTISGMVTHFYNLSVTASALIDVSAGNLIKVYNNLINDGTFTLKTNTIKTAMLIDAGIPSKLTGTGIYNIERYISQGGWHYISSPIVLTANSVNFLWGAALYDYDEPTHTWLPKIAGQQLEVMKGYDAYFKNGDKTVVFIGKYNTGSITTNVTKSSDGSNFIGNPYTCTVDWDIVSGWSKTNIDNAIYIWDPTLNTGQGDYMEYVNGVGNRGGTKFIPPTQAFWVICNNASGGSVTINNAAKSTDTTAYFRSENDNNIIRIKASQPPYDNETTINLNPEASQAFDSKYDALKIFHSNASIPQLYTVSSDKRELAINSLNEQNPVTTVPLALKAGMDGNCTLTFDLSEFDNLKNVFLEDKLENTITDLRTVSEYSFKTRMSDKLNRFMLHFTSPDQLTNDVNQSLPDSKSSVKQKYYMYYINNQLYISLNSGSGNCKLRIFDISGKEIVSRNINVSGIVSMPINLKQGVYVVSLTDFNQQFTSKIVVGQ